MGYARSVVAKDINIKIIMSCYIEEVLWEEFYYGQSDVEKVIEQRWANHRATHGDEWYPKLEEWESLVRKWWYGEYYEKDRQTYKAIFDRLIGYYRNDVLFDYFTFDVDLHWWGDDDVKVTIEYVLRDDAEELTRFIDVRGKRDTIIADIDRALVNEGLI